MRPMRIAFLIRTLETGGAERQLTELAKGLAQRGHAVLVLVYYAVGPWAREIEAAGGQVHQLGKRGRWDLRRTGRQIVSILRQFRPDVVHSYMVGSNIMVGMLQRQLRPARLVFGVRGTYTDFPTLSFRVFLSVERLLSRFVDLIVCNSQAARAHCASRGYPESRLVVVPNGIDTNRFRPDPDARSRLRSQWGFDAGHVVIGVVARLDVMKDHMTFLRAAAVIAAQMPQVRFVCVGDGEDAELQRLLRTETRRLGLEPLLRWEPATTRPEDVYNALDIGVQPSQFNEGFPNVIAEGMSCGLLYVATRVGDAPLVIGDPRYVVQPRDPEALAQLVLRVIASGEYRDRASRRESIERRFSVARMVDSTEQLLRQLVGSPQEDSGGDPTHARVVDEGARR